MNAFWVIHCSTHATRQTRSQQLTRMSALILSRSWLRTWAAQIRNTMLVRQCLQRARRISRYSFRCLSDVPLRRHCKKKMTWNSEGDNRNTANDGIHSSRLLVTAIIEGITRNQFQLLQCRKFAEIVLEQQNSDWQRYCLSYACTKRCAASNSI